MDETGHGVGWHIRAWAVAFERAGWLIIAMPLTWLLYPVLVVTTMHWEDGAGLPYYLRGELIPRFFPNATMNRTALTIVAVWLLLLLVTFVFTIMFNRRVQLPLALWPMCFLIVGFVCNFIWFFEKGFWDTPGAIAGTAPVVVLAIFQKICDRIGAGFVYGGSLRNMSVPETPGGGLGMILAAMLQGGLNMRRKAKTRRAMRDLLDGLREIERQEAERRREAVEAVRQQMARGSAGNATRAQRRQARRNPLDERFF